MRKKTHAEHVAEIAAKNPNVEIIGKITGGKDKVLTRCRICGHEWEAIPSNLKSGQGCPICGKIKSDNAKRLTHAEQVAAIAKVNPDVEILGEITGNSVKVLCRCKVCNHEWNATPGNLKSGYGCPRCRRVKIANAKRLPHAKHVADIKKANPNIEILEEIKNARTKVLCRCLVCHHEWEALPGNLKRYGCPKCAIIRNANAQRLTNTEQVTAIQKVNPDVEVLEEIKGNDEKVKCRCKVCDHKWNARPSSLKNGHGCPKCNGGLKLSHKEQVEAIAKVNPNIEILGEITGNAVKVPCRCKICSHEWEAIPNDLKHGKGCPRCAKTGFLRHDIGKLYIMVDDLELPTMMKIGVSVREDERSKRVLSSARRAGVTIPALHVAKTWEGPTDLMQRIEQMMHENYEEWNIKFPAKFDGCTEFFYYTPETATAFEVIEETLHEIINGNKAA